MRFEEQVSPQGFAYFLKNMWEGEVTSKTNQCAAYITREREGVTSQQAAESLNGAYRELGYRDDPLVEVAEKAVQREIKLQKDQKAKYRKWKEEEDICGPRVRAKVL